MPTYEYQCKKCGKVMEAFHGMSEEGPKRCDDPKCKGKLIRLVGAGSGLIFKGSGFYITDYKNKSTDYGAKSAEGAKNEKSEKSEKSEKGDKGEKSGTTAPKESSSSEKSAPAASSDSGSSKSEKKKADKPAKKD